MRRPARGGKSSLSKTSFLRPSSLLASAHRLQWQAARKQCAAKSSSGAGAKMRHKPPPSPPASQPTRTGNRGAATTQTRSKRGLRAQSTSKLDRAAVSRSSAGPQAHPSSRGKRVVAEQVWDREVRVSWFFEFCRNSMNLSYSTCTGMIRVSPVGGSARAPLPCFSPLGLTLFTAAGQSETELA